MRERILAILGARRLPLLLALAAMVPYLPALRLGVMGDDYFHRMMLLGIEPFSGDRPLFDLFTFFRGPEGNGPLIELGLLPWWSAPELRVAFFRPLSSATHLLDYALFPDLFWLQHLHSLLWWGLGVGLVAVLYRQLIDRPAVAGLAAVLFAVEDAHSMPVAWLANRNAVVALVFGVAALTLHVRWRRSGERRWLPAALLAGCCGLAAGEAALGALAYVAAWQLFVDGPGWRARLEGLAPWVVLGVFYTAMYGALGYGASHSGLYVDPAAEPLRFAASLLERWPLLMAAQWFSPPVDVWLMLPRAAQVAMSAVAALGLGGIVWLLWGLLRDSAMARFWAGGMALCLVPPCGAFPLDRLTLFAGLGGFALVALMAERALGFAAAGDEPTPRDPRRTVRWAVVALLLLHGPMALAALTPRVLLVQALGNFFSLGAQAGPTDEGVVDQTFVFVTGSELPTAYTAPTRGAIGLPIPRRTAQLASMITTNRVTRIDAHTLEIEPEGGFLATMMDTLTRHPEDRFELGEEIARPDFVAHVDALTEDGRPAVVSFRFEAPLEDPSLVWLYFVDGWPRELTLPGVGESFVIPATLPRLD